MNDNLQDELSRTLHRQADGVSGAPISFEAVRGTAGRIRNRRRAMVAGAVLAVGAAIAVPTMVMGGFGEDRGTPPVIAPGDPTPGETTNGTYPDGLTIRGLEQGDAPRIAWLEGTTLHRADGSEATLPKPYVSVAPFSGDHWVAVDRQDRVDLLADDGLYVVDTWRAFENARLVTNADGNVGWMGADGTAQVLTEGATVPRELGPFTLGTQLVAVTGDCSTDAETTEGGGCAVWTNFEDAGDSVFMTMGSHTQDAQPASRAIIRGTDVHAVEGGVLRAGITEVKDDTSTCSALVGPQADNPTWTTCDHRPITFSPDGETLLAFDTIGDGIGEGVLAFLSADDGEVLLDRNNHDSQAFYNHAVWEDDEHVLAAVFQEGEWAMVRVGTDGSMEYAVAPRPGSDLEVPYFLATQP